MEYIKEIQNLIGDKRLIVPTTVCAIIDAENRILLQQRSDGGKWGFPGGIMDLGETVTECMRREVLEETGLIVRGVELLGIYSGPQYYATYPSGDKTAPVQIVFITRDFSGKLRFDHESLDLHFFSFGTLPESLSSKWKKCIFDANNYVNGKEKFPIIL